MIGSTGPNVSSRMTAMPWSTSTSTVGSYQRPVAALDPPPAGEHPGAARPPRRPRGARRCRAAAGTSSSRCRRRPTCPGARPACGPAPARRTARTRPRRRRPARRSCTSGRSSGTRPTPRPAAARSRSASSHTIIGSLPPSSSSTGVKRVGRRGHHPLAGAGRAGEADLLHARRARAPRRWRRRRSRPARGRDGRRPSAKRSPIRQPTSGVTSDGFNTTVLPASAAVIDRGHGQDERVVPRADDAHHAQRLVATLGHACGP